jgi:hypothetical protein
MWALLEVIEASNPHARRLLQAHQRPGPWDRRLQPPLVAVVAILAPLTIHLQLLGG